MKWFSFLTLLKGLFYPIHYFAEPGGPGAADTTTTPPDNSGQPTPTHDLPEVPQKPTNWWMLGACVCAGIAVVFFILYISAPSSSDIRQKDTRITQMTNTVDSLQGVIRTKPIAQTPVPTTPPPAVTTPATPPPATTTPTTPAAGDSTDLAKAF